VVSHKLLAREDWPDYEFAYHENDELGRKILSRVAKHAGLQPEICRVPGRVAQQILRRRLPLDSVTLTAIKSPG